MSTFGISCLFASAPLVGQIAHVPLQCLSLSFSHRSDDLVSKGLFGVCFINPSLFLRVCLNFRIPQDNLQGWIRTLDKIEKQSIFIEFFCLQTRTNLIYQNFIFSSFKSYNNIVVDFIFLSYCIS